MLPDLIEESSKPGQLIRRSDPQPQRIRRRHLHTGQTRPRLQHIEMLTTQRRSQQPTQRLPLATLRTHRRTQRVDPPVAVEQPGHAALIPGPSPRLTTSLGRQRTNRALVLEPVTMLIGALTTSMAAIQPWATRTANHHELDRTPRTGPMSRATMRDDRHHIVVPQGCHTAPRTSRPTSQAEGRRTGIADRRSPTPSPTLPAESLANRQ